MSNSIVFVRCVDPVSKKTYYFNKMTQEAQWSIPHGLNLEHLSQESSKKDKTYVNYYAKVNNSFTASKENELSIVSGEYIHVLRSYESGWAAGVNKNNESGYFPLKCVSVVTPHVSRVQTPSMLLHQSSSIQRGYSHEIKSIRSLASLHHSSSNTSETTHTTQPVMHTQRRMHNQNQELKKDSNDVINLFYRVFVESVLSQDEPSKEDIASIESLRQKYRIPLQEHLSILSDMDKGIAMYAEYLDKFNLLSKREIQSTYYSEITSENAYSNIHCYKLEDSPTNFDSTLCDSSHSPIFRPFSSLLPRETLYKSMESHPPLFYFPFSTFANAYFYQNLSSKQKDGLTLFSPTTPTHSLLWLEDEDCKDAVEAETLIMMYMGDVEITENPSLMFNRLKELLRKNENVRADCYCFIMKQTTANMQQESELRGWELMNVMLSVVLPPDNLFPYVVFYICDSLFNLDMQYTGLKINALRQITGQCQGFELSQNMFETLSKEVIQTYCFDVSLDEVVRIEYVMDILKRYNLLAPGQQVFGSTIEPAPLDYYNIATNPTSILSTLKHGVNVLRKSINSRSQRCRYFKVAPTLDRILFYKSNEGVDQSVSLYEILKIEYSATVKEVPLVVLMLINHKNIAVHFDSEFERNRWLLYLKVLLQWYKTTGYNLIESMKSSLDSENQDFLCSLNDLNDRSSLSSHIASVLNITTNSFKSYINENVTHNSLHPFNIDSHYHCPTHSVPYLVVKIVENLARCRAFLLVDPFRNIIPLDSELKEQVYYVLQITQFHSKGNYFKLDEVKEPRPLFALLRDWMESIEGTILPDVYAFAGIKVAQEGTEEDLYKLVLTFPPIYRDTLLYLIRTAWQYTLFSKSFNTPTPTPESFARMWVFAIYPKKAVLRSTNSLESYTNFIATLFTAVSVHERESFLPPDPTEAAIEEYKVLLYSRIRPSHTPCGYEYTIENLSRMEQTAEDMFAFGVLPETNTFGCSPHRLPASPSSPIQLFVPFTEYMLKNTETRIYHKGHLWIGPFLDCLFYEAKPGELQRINLFDIKTIVNDPPINLLDYEKRSIQGRCITINCTQTTNTLDILFHTAERRNSFLNVLDLFMEWEKEESDLLWNQQSDLITDDMDIYSIVDFDELRNKFPQLLPFAESLHASFSEYVADRDDRLTSISFEKYKQDTWTSDSQEIEKKSSNSGNPKVFKIFMVLCDALVRVKAHMEEGVFRHPGTHDLVVEYTESIRKGDYDIVKTLTGFKDITSLIGVSCSFVGERLIPISFLPAIEKVNKQKDSRMAFELVCKMPEVNCNSLLYLCHMWGEIAKFSVVNKMSVENICTCICPSLINITNNAMFLKIVTPLYPFVKLVILALDDVDLEKLNIHFSFE